MNESSINKRQKKSKSSISLLWYVLIFIGFSLWLIFLDENSVVKRNTIHKKIKKLEKQKEFYTKKIKKDRLANEELLKNKENLEKFARERYFMKKKNEDIFIITED